MRIMLVTSTLNQGGIERQISVLAPRLQERGHDVTIAVFYSGDFYESSLREQGIRIQALTLGGRDYRVTTAGKVLRWGQRASRLAWLARRHRIDVVYSFGMGANMISIMAKATARSKIAWGIRNSLPTGSSTMSHAEKAMARFADTVISNSVKGSRAYIASGLPATKFQHLPNGIDTAMFTPDPGARRELRAQFRISDDEVLIGTVGRLDSNKDRESFLRAAAVVANKLHGARFMIIGGGDSGYVARLNGLATALGLQEKLDWIPPRGDIHRYLNAMDIFVSSSITEGFPNVVAEAMAVGVPCVVTDAGESANIVGTLGGVVPVSDPDRLATAIVETAARLPDIDHDAIRQKVAESYSLQAMVDRTERALMAIL